MINCQADFNFQHFTEENGEKRLKEEGTQNICTATVSLKGY